MADDSAEIEHAAIVARDYDVFISYAHVDADRDVASAQRIAAWLADLGYSVWWDRKLIAGQKWPKELKTKIERSARVVVLWSPRAAQSDWVGFETKLADIEDKLVPLVIEPHPTPETWASTHRVVVTDFAAQQQAILDLLNLPPPSRRTGDAAGLDDARVAIAELPTGAGRLIGRDLELAALHAAWDSTAPGADPAQKTNVVVLHAIGGAGKTALMRRFLDDLADQGFPGAEKVFGWSAYSQDSGEDRNVSPDKFLSDALRHFGWDVDKEPIKDQLQKGRTLARLVRGGRNLFILDGLEPLQAPPEVNGGYLKDRGVAALVKELAADNAGLLIITSRQRLPELASAGSPRVLDGALEALSPPAGAELLGELGVWGAQEELEAASVELEGHALSLSLIGTYLDAVYAGDVRKRDHFDFAEAVAGAAKQGQRRAKRAQHVMARYVARFAEIEAATGDGGAELAILRMVGLFDRPAPKDALDELLREPAIAGLTDAFHGIAEHERNERWAWAIRRLRALKLLNSEDERDRGALDAHPVVREHFAAELKATAPAAYTEAHSRLYDFFRFAFLNGLDLPDALRTSEAYGLLALCAAYPDNVRAFKEHALQGQVPPGSQNVVSRSLLKGNARRIAAAANLIGGPHFAQLLAKFQPNDEVEMQPCFAAIAHGCAAGRLAEALIELYMPRVRRGNAGFAIRQLSLHGTNLAAISAFFASPFTTPLPGVAADHQALLLGFAGYSLRAVGRLTEAIGTMRLAVKLDVERSRWSSAAVNAGLLSEQQLTLGNVAEALRVGAEAVDIADRSERPFWRITSRTVHGAALHAAGKITDAARLFEEARRMQAAAQPVHAHLYSARGYKYCDLLLTQGRAAEATELGEKMAQSRARDPNTPLLDHGVETLALGRAHATMAQQTPAAGGQGEGPRMHAALAGRLLDEAVARLIAANEEDYIPAGFLARAGHRRWLCATTGDAAQRAGAEQDLADAEEIARRDEPNGGAMRLYLTDIALERCRLCLAGLPQPLAADPVEPAMQEASAESQHDSNPGPQQANSADDDWQRGIVDLRREAAAALQDSGPADASLAGPPKPLRRWDMWSWLEQEKARSGAAPEQQSAAPAQDAPAGEPAPEAEAPTSAPDTHPLTPEQRELIRRAEAHWQDAARLIEDTGYHRRDGERDDLRRTLDRLSAIE